jgi:hypothetical protein
LILLRYNHPDIEAALIDKKLLFFSAIVSDMDSITIEISVENQLIMPGVLFTE